MPRLSAHEIKIAELERMVGKLTIEFEFLRGVLRSTPLQRGAITSIVTDSLSVRRGCELMNLARSTFYCQPIGQRPDEARIVEKIAEICVEYPRYGYRRVTAQLHREGLRVNHKKALRIMREQGFSVRPRRRYVAGKSLT